ncbi:MAG TPA: methyltransferase domain-containing protein [Ktedonobacteraceae bacterium]|nr:methyltransferase domain-containing protein [Ktedonobacteraceae bacterium]
MADNEEAKDENTYLFDPESATEMARLIEQDRFTTEATGGPFSGIPAPDSLRQILDLACGPGSWVLDVAFALPDAEVAGVDISKTMTDYAHARARSQGLSNASFGVMDITKPLDFADASFDLINARALVAVLRREHWQPFIAECQRVLRPGGILRLSEPIDGGNTNSPAFERLQELGALMMKRAGYGFSVDGRTYALSPILPGLLRASGFQDVHTLAYAMEFSAGMPAWADVYHNYEVIIHAGTEAFVKTGVATAEEVERLFQRMIIEMNQDDFRGMWHMITILGTKPLEKA